MGTRGNENTYVLERTAEEDRRLRRQAALLDPFTQRLFAAAGIGPGMQVLDVGCGAGDVAMLAATMVGPTGQVLGIDSDETTIETARHRARLAGHANITFLVGDLRDL